MLDSEFQLASRKDKQQPRRQVFEKMLSVGPPQAGKALDSKIENKKDFLDSSSMQTKKEFEKALKEKVDKKDDTRDKDKLVAKKEEKEPKVDKKDKKSSGGTKKKMTDVSDDKMISNFMASSENEIEIPESKIDLAEIEIGTENIEVKKGDVLGLQQANEETQLFDQQFSKSEVAEVLNSQEVPQELQVQAAPVEVAKNAAQMEQELQEDVGFQSDFKEQMSKSDLVQKMKSFEAEKNLTGAKAVDFENQVLAKLKNESLFNSNMNQNSKEFGAGEEGKDSLKQMGADAFKADGAQHVGQSNVDFKSHLASTPTHSVDAAPQLSSHDQEANIKEIMNQAKFLVTKGGGEMTVKMSPEGLGEVQMKVALQDGKLNIEMQTQDKSVKKLIEDSLSELKSGLAAHRLSVEHVKINTVNATNTENNAQFQQNWNHAGSEGKQREFWKQFQDNMNNQPRRSSYAGVADIKKQSPTTSVQSEKAAAVQRAYGRTGATVNRVA